MIELVDKIFVLMFLIIVKIQLGQIRVNKRVKQNKSAMEYKMNQIKEKILQDQITHRCLIA